MGTAPRGLVRATTTAPERFGYAQARQTCEHPPSPASPHCPAPLRLGPRRRNDSPEVRFPLERGRLGSADSSLAHPGRTAPGRISAAASRHPSLRRLRHGPGRALPLAGSLPAPAGQAGAGFSLSRTAEGRRVGAGAGEDLLRLWTGEANSAIIPLGPVPAARGGGWHNGWHLRRKSRQKPAKGRSRTAREEEDLSHRRRAG